MPTPAELDTSLDGQAVPKRVWKATLLQVGGRVWGSGCTFIILALLARHLQAAEFGRFTFLLAIFALLDSLSDFGTGAVAVERSASDSSLVAPVLRQARRARLVTSSIGFLGLCLWMAVEAPEGPGWILAAAIYPFTHALELSATVFKRRISWGVPVVARAIASTLRLGLALLCLQLNVQSAAIFLFATAAGSATANLMLHFAARPHLRDLPQSTAEIPSILPAALPLGVAAICQQTYFYVDNLFVRKWCGEEELGLYNSGVRLLAFFIMFAQYAHLSALPWLSRRHDQGELGESVGKLTLPLFAGASLACGLILPHSARLLELIFGPGFERGGPSFAWLLGAVAVIYAGASFLSGLIASGHTRSVLVVAALGLLVNLVGNAWLTPQFGIEGAAIATFCTELTVAVGAGLALAKFGASPLGKWPLAWFLPAALFALGVWASRALLA